MTEGLSWLSSLMPILLAAAAVLALACAWRARSSHGRARRLYAGAALVLGAAAAVGVAAGGPVRRAAPVPAPAAEAAGGAPHGQDTAEIDRMVAALRTTLAATPGDAGNWVLLGRTLGTEQRWAEAQDAFAHALAIRPDDADLHAQMGEVLTLRAHGTVTRQALAEFAHAPDDPRSRFYNALALAQDGHVPQAIDKLHALAADAPQDAEWRQLVLDELQVLGGPQQAGPPPALSDQLQDELSTLSAGSAGTQTQSPQTQSPPLPPSRPAPTHQDQ